MSSSSTWQEKSAVPGRVKPIYGAKYPPPSMYPSIVSNVNHDNNSSIQTNNNVFGLEKDPNDRAFAQFNASTLDVWSADDNDLISKTAKQVIAHHEKQNIMNSTDTMLGGNPGGVSPSHITFIREQALQRLATQRADVISGSAIGIGQLGTPTTSSIYPRLLDTSQTPPSSSRNEVQTKPSTLNKKIISSYRQRQLDSTSPSLSMTTANDNRIERLEMLLEMDSLDLAELRKLCWKGIPQRLRPNIWRILSGYQTTNKSRRAQTLANKREEYFRYVEQYFHTRYDEQHEKTFRQIHIDIPRMCPLIPLFQQKIVQEMFERILYIWAIRHPASGYVQGINDLVTPFFVVFLSELIDDNKQSISSYDVSALDVKKVQDVEADSFWCVSALLDVIQDNYTFSMPGIQRKVYKLSMLMSKIDAKLHKHLLAHQVEYLQFAFRWMNNLLMRELPLRSTIRLWDTYMSEINGFSDFHVYVCAAFLRMWSKPLQDRDDFQQIMVYLQNLPTNKWADQQISELCADAFTLKCLFAGAQSHLN